jgi:multiple sugar transport system permease protein
MNSQAISPAPVAKATVTTRGGSIRRSRRWALILAYVFLGIFAVFFLFPPYYMIITSFKTDVEISTLKGSPWIINQSPTLYHYTNLLTNTSIPHVFPEHRDRHPLFGDPVPCASA